MDYTEEQLTQIEQYASIYLKISDMAVSNPASRGYC